MFVTLEDGRKFRVTFRHVQQKPPKPNSTADDLKETQRISALLDQVESTYGVPAFSLRGYTECFIGPDPGEMPQEPQGLAMCSYLDPFNKEKGRKLALARALDTIFPTTHLTNRTDILAQRNRRLAFWTVYFNRIPLDVEFTPEE